MQQGPQGLAGVRVELDEAWDELGLTPGADAAEVKAAWRRLASAWHPDRNPSADAAQRMQRLNQAMDCIRQWRDDGEPLVPPRPRRPPEPPPARARTAAERPAEPPPPPPPPRPPSVHMLDREVTLTLDEAILGCERHLHGQVEEACDTCEGSGRLPDEMPCEACNGRGRVRQAGWFGWGASDTDCEACSGTGVVHPECPDCQGSGRLAPRPWRLRARIPPGVQAGDVLEVAPGREGGPHAGVGVQLRIELLPHPLFQVGADGVLRCEMPVDGLAWLAGATVQVPVPGGWQALTLVRNVVSHRLAGQGLPQGRRGPRGDLELHLSPQFPERFTEDQRALLERLSQDTRARAESTEGHPLQRWQQAVADWQRQQRRKHGG